MKCKAVFVLHFIVVRGKCPVLFGWWLGWFTIRFCLNFLGFGRDIRVI